MRILPITNYSSRTGKINTTKTNSTKDMPVISNHPSFGLKAYTRYVIIAPAVLAVLTTCVTPLAVLLLPWLIEKSDKALEKEEREKE